MSAKQAIEDLMERVKESSLAINTADMEADHIAEPLAHALAEETICVFGGVLDLLECLKEETTLGK
jgi:hypothetical protein